MSGQQPILIRTRPLGIMFMLMMTLMPARGATANEAVQFERWYTALLDSRPVGWMHVKIVRCADEYHSQSEMAISVRRGESVVSIMLGETFVETGGGEPLHTTQTQKLAGQTITRKLVFGRDVYTLTTSNGSSVQTREYRPSALPWLTPMAAERYVTEQMNQGVKKITFWTLGLATGIQPVEVAHTVLRTTNIEVLGKTVPATEIHTTMSVLPSVRSTEYMDREGHMIKTSSTLGPWKFIIVESDEQLAKAKIDPPELMTRLFVRSNRPIAMPRRIRSAEYELRLDRSATDLSDLDLPSIGCQRLVHSNGQTARIRVDLEVKAEVQDRPQEEHRIPSAMIDSNDEKIRGLSEEGLAKYDEAVKDHVKAQALCRFVHRYIENRDLSVGFATATEVAQTARGDCSEFAVLLAAMLRAVNIPSRTISGLVYVEQFMGQQDLFGYHMWTQAWIENGQVGYWMDLDAALNPDHFDATHIAVSSSAMSDDQFFNDMVKLAPLLGRLSISVIETNSR